eukprot:m.365999 g.365999  ORF g.365999 m.365999 type:complete len:142 (-) comp56064_c0_seq5:29-454(-)
MFLSVPVVAKTASSSFKSCHSSSLSPRPLAIHTWPISTGVSLPSILAKTVAVLATSMCLNSSGRTTLSNDFSAHLLFALHSYCVLALLRDTTLMLCPCLLERHFFHAVSLPRCNVLHLFTPAFCRAPTTRRVCVAGMECFR